MTCAGCKERAEILRNELPKVRSAQDMANLSRKIIGTFATVKRPAQPWKSPPSVNKDGSPFKDSAPQAPNDRDGQ